MLEIYSLFNNSIIVLQLLLIIVFFVLCLVIWQRNRSYRRLVEYYQTLMDSYEAGNIEKILEQVIKAEQENRVGLEGLDQRLKSIEERLPHLISRVSLLRYKGLPDVGGDLSFSLAVLDEKGCGFLLTGIHGREETRVYAKSITEYASLHQLSAEEKQVIKGAQEKR